MTPSPFHTNLKLGMNSKIPKISDKKHLSDMLHLITKKSSLPAVSKISKEKTRTKKYFWIIVQVVLSVSCVFHASKLIIRYIDHPVVVTVKIETLNSLEFPKITICNLNRVRKMYTSCLKEHRSDISDCTIDRNRGPGFAPSQTVGLNEQKKPSPREVLVNSKGQNVTGEQEFLYDYYRTPEKVRMGMSHEQGLMRMEFVFQGKVAMKYGQGLVKTLNTRYGKCYSFIPPKDANNQTVKITKTGPENGLIVSFNIEDNNYHKVTDTLGGKLFIGEISEAPNPEERGLTLTPGLENSVALRQTLVNYHRCKDYSSESNGRSRRECEKRCIQRVNVANCGCADPTMAMASRLKNCSVINVQQMACLKKARDFLKNDVCDCPEACRSTSCDARLSHAGYPSLESKRVEYWGPTLTRDTPWWNNFKTTIKLNVFYSSLERKTFEQVPCFPLSKFLSCLGGAFAFWLGMSIIFFYEIIEKIISFSFNFDLYR